MLILQKIKDVEILMKCLKDILENKDIDYDYEDILSETSEYIKLYEKSYN